MNPSLTRSLLRSGALVGFLLLFVGAVLLAHALGQNPDVQAFVASTGYAGVVFAGIVAGLNFVVPLPAATLTPLFAGAGLSLPVIVIALAVGTIIADFIGYAFGRVGRDVIKDRYPRTFALFRQYGAQNSWFVYPLVFLYAAFVPFPNEAILIPMAVVGYRFRTLLIPLLIGNLINQAILVYGITGLLGSM